MLMACRLQPLQASVSAAPSRTASITDTPAVLEVVASRRRPLPLMGNIRDLLELLMASNTTCATISVV